MSEDKKDDGTRTLGQEAADALNPIWHFPLVSQFSRWVTGKKMSDDANLVGGLLYAAGTSSALADVQSKKMTGLDIQDTLKVKAGITDRADIDTTKIGSSKLTELALMIPGVAPVIGSATGVIHALPSLEKKPGPNKPN